MRRVICVKDLFDDGIWRGTSARYGARTQEITYRLCWRRLKVYSVFVKVETFGSEMVL